MTFSADDLATPDDFERFLCAQGFSQGRARAITAKGFNPAGHEPVIGVDALVTRLQARQGRLVREIKNRQRLRLLAGPDWSPWKRTTAFTATADARVAVKAYSTNPGGTKGPFFLKIRHTIPGGRRVISRWQSNGGMSGNGPYPVAAGIQELEISAMASPPAFAQNVVVDVDWA